MELPIENGAKVAKEWQPISALIWVGPISRCASFIAAKTGRSGQPVQKFGGRGGMSPTVAATVGVCASATSTSDAILSASIPDGRVSFRNAASARKNTAAV